MVAFPLSQLVALALLYSHALTTPATPSQWRILLVITLLCVVVDVVLIRAIAETARHRLVDEHVRILEEQKEMQRQQYQRLMDEVGEARRVRRDIIGALVESREFLRRADVPRAVASMERAMGFSGGVRESYCENRVVNALLMMKFRRCAEEGVDVTCMTVVPEHLNILDVDLCAAFSNLLDNAIKGSEGLPPGQRSLDVRACLVAGVMMMDVRNAVAPYGAGEGRDGQGREGGEERKRSGSVGGEGSRGRERAVRNVLRGGTAGHGRGRAAEPRHGIWRRGTARVGAGNGEGGRFEGRLGPSTLACRHGWGLQILEVLALRYNGTFECGREGEHEFRATLMLMNEAQERS